MLESIATPMHLGPPRTSPCLSAIATKLENVKLRIASSLSGTGVLVPFTDRCYTRPGVGKRERLSGRRVMARSGEL